MINIIENLESNINPPVLPAYAEAKFLASHRQAFPRTNSF